MIRNFIAVAVMFVSLGSCMLPDKINKIVTGYYVEQKSALQPVKNTGKFSFVNDTLPKPTQFSATRLTRFYFIPFGIYYYSREEAYCSINKSIYADKVISELIWLSQHESYKEKLKGKIIELKLLNMPVTFSHKFQNHYIVLPLMLPPGYLGIPFTKNQLYHPEGSITISYTVRDSASAIVLKSGEVKESVKQFGTSKPRDYSRTEFIRSYVKSFDFDLNKGCARVAESIINKI